ncbi:ATP-binding protein [Streptomyces sp. NPDC058657]|uniref:ATP-binding protein n=1 Tax=unclassified Streptomyces TaxID=2593676 RepID=UPI0036666887
MKQSAAKTLGVAALGAAFAATAAGSASAAPALPDAAGALGSVTSVLPVGQVASVLPAGSPEALAAGQAALGQITTTAPAALSQATDKADPVGGLLGGLPTKGLPAGGLPTGALPGLGG